MKARYLTKSRFKLGMECPNKLFYTRKKEYANQQEENSFLQSLAEGGFQVEELARLHYPGGELISGNDGDYDWLVEETNKLLKRKDVIIYEAAFKFENLFIRTDILVKKGNDIELIEVKAKSFHSDDDEFVSSTGKITSNWRPYLYDLAFQKHVIMQSYPQWKVSAFLMLADKSKTASIDGLNQLFRITGKADNRTGIIMPPGLTLKDTGKSVLGLAPMDEVLYSIYNGTEAEDDYTFFELVKTLSEHYKKDKKFNYPVGWHCKGCEFKLTEGDDSSLKSGFEECWKEQKKWKPAHFAKPKTFELWDFRKGSKLFEEKGKIFLDQLTEDDVDVKPAPGRISRTERQWIQIEKTLANDATPYIEKEGLRTEMKKWKFPLNFIDFETSGVALPFTKGMKPYEQVAFQFSHHILHKDGQIEHASEFISHKPGEFPNFIFIRALKQSLEGNKGSIFRYHNHENTILNVILNQLKVSKEKDKKELIEFIKSIAVSTNSSAENWDVPERNMIDLCVVIKHYYYHPAMKGSNSIKAVLPAILQGSDFLKNKYCLPIEQLKLSSKNFPNSQVWLNYENGSVVNPYKKLPPLFDDWSEDEIENAVSELESINDGGGALTAYAKLQYEIMEDKERSKIVSGLLKYCELDTLAMVMLYEGLRAEVDI